MKPDDRQSAAVLAGAHQAGTLGGIDRLSCILSFTWRDGLASRGGASALGGQVLWSGGVGKRHPWVVTSIGSLPRERTHGAEVSSPAERIVGVRGRSKRASGRACTARERSNAVTSVTGTDSSARVVGSCSGASTGSLTGSSSLPDPAGDGAVAEGANASEGIGPSLKSAAGGRDLRRSGGNQADSFRDVSGQGAAVESGSQGC